MKQATEIFRHLWFASDKKIGFYCCLSKIKKLLPPLLAEGIIGGYQKGETLYLLLANKTLEFEANYKLNSLTPILREFVASCSECDGVSFTKIRAYSKIAQTPPMPERTFLEKERSDGKFENRFKSKPLYERLELIRALIKKNGC